MLDAALGPDGNGLIDREIRDQVVTLVVTGYATTSAVAVAVVTTGAS